MKINRNKGNLQSELQKMLQAGRENVEGDAGQKTVQQGLPVDNEPQRPTAQTLQGLHATEQPNNSILAKEPVVEETTSPASALSPKPVAAKPKQRQATKSQPKTTKNQAEQRLNASQRHEVPDHNTKYAGEPIKSVGCRMPQSLYARMLQYKALNDSQVNRITLNDVIIEAVERFLDEQ